MANTQCEVELIVTSLLEKPSIYEDILKPLEERKDDFVCQVLRRARASDPRVVCKMNKRDKNNVVRTFLTRKRKVAVFEEWLLFPATRNYLENKESVTVSIRHTDIDSPSVAHAFAQWDRSDILRVLVQEYPFYLDFKVTIMKENKPPPTIQNIFLRVHLEAFIFSVLAETLRA